nr:phosphatidylinositol mannoside acyltransferase [Nanchangia anserum]
MLLTGAVGLAEVTPPRILEVGARVVGSAVAARGGEGIDYLRAHLSRLLGRPASAGEVREAMTSYMRYFAQACSLGGVSANEIDARVEVRGRIDAVRAGLQAGPVVVALTHSANWDLAGAWAARHGADVVTVAERIEPPELFDMFMRVRRGVGMEIISATPGQRIFDDLVARVRGRSCLVALLADRDITGRGVEVDLAGGRALVAAGPAALAARLNAPLIPVDVRERRLSGAARSLARASWGITLEFADPVAVTDVAATTQRWVDAVSERLRQHPTSWHMLQPLFIDELDPERLARSRARLAKEDA